MEKRILDVTRILETSERNFRFRAVANAEVVICGGGISGTSIAYHLAKKGKKVALVEKDSLVVRNLLIQTLSSQNRLLRCHGSLGRSCLRTDILAGHSTANDRSGVTGSLRPSCEDLQVP